MMITNYTALPLLRKTQLRMVYVLLLSILAGCGQFAMAQVDKEFWFAVPFIGNHGNGNSELVVSNMDKLNAVTVNISNPAAPVGGWGVVGRNFNIPAGQSLRIDLNSLYGTPKSPVAIRPGTLYANLDNAQLATQLTNNKGLLIKSTGDITAFYELGRQVPGFDQGNNIEIFSLKGSNSLGTDFMLPFQNQYLTWNNDQSYSSANIIASEYNTQITINPTQAAVGHPAGVPFTITLNKGQTFTLRAVGLEANRHLSGTKVSSNKPIAITLVDDSLETNQANFGNGNGGIDIVGDQIVPLSVLGKEYIVALGNAGTNNNLKDRNRIFILTTQDNTNITITENGNVTQTYNNQNAGVTNNFLQSNTSPAAYIKSDKPIYVFYVSGSNNELGGALIPPTVCTGSDVVNIVRSSDSDISLIILVKNKAINDFKFSIDNVPVPTSTFISAGDFKQISTGPEGFSVYNKLFNNLSIIPLLKTVSISNQTSVFHAGIAVTGSSAGSFGYFSDFSSINISYENKPVCFGEKLELDAGENRDTYKWYTKPTPATENVLSSSQKYLVTSSGEQKIYLRVTKKNCVLEDSLTVYVQPKVNLSILRKKIACDNQPVSMDATPEVTVPQLNIIKYVWYSTTPTIPDVPTDTFARTQNVSVKFPVSTGTPAVPHEIIVKVTDDKGCVSTDTVKVTIRPTPPIIVGTFSDASVCSGLTVQLGQPSINNKLIYNWLENSGTTPTIKQPATGLNSLIISNPIATKQNITTPPALPTAILHKYYIETIDTSTSCIKLDSLILTVNPIPKAQISLTKNKFCKSDPAFNLTGSAPNYTGGTYNFFVNGNATTQFDPTTASTSSSSKITLKYVSAAPASCPAPDVDSTVIVSDKPTVTMTNVDYCSGKSVTIGVQKDNLYKYLWNTTSDISRLDSFEAKINVLNTITPPAPDKRTYTLTVTSKTNATCTNSGTVEVTINPQPVASFSTVNPLGYCEKAPAVTFTGTPAGGTFASLEGGISGNTFTPSKVGANKVTYTVTTFGCTDDTVVNITVHPLPVPEIYGMKATYCVGEPINITGSANAPSVGGFGIPNVPASNGNFPSTTVGTYQFRYGITTDKGCTDSTSKSLTITPLPVVAVNNPAPICVGEQTTLTASGGNTYLWENLPGTTSSVVVKPIINSTYKVYAVGSDNCKSLPQTIAVTVNNTPIAEFPQSTITHCFDEGTIKISAGIAPTYLWSDGSATDSLEVTQAGNFQVTLSDGSCSSSDEVKVIAACPPRIFLPKAFSPNNDGYNDSLQIFGDHFKDLKLRIFNRWGEVIFETTQKDKMWDGTYNGLPMPQGVYPWALVFKSELPSDKNKEYTLDGSVSIIQ